MREVVSINPFRCRMWSLHDRLDTNVTEQSCRDEIASFATHGQLVPALGRSLRDDSHYDVELIYGARRLFVARHLNKPLLVELSDDVPGRTEALGLERMIAAVPPQPELSRHAT